MALIIERWFDTVLTAYSFRHIVRFCSLKNIEEDVLVTARRSGRNFYEIGRPISTSILLVQSQYSWFYWTWTRCDSIKLAIDIHNRTNTNKGTLYAYRWLRLWLQLRLHDSAAAADQLQRVLSSPSMGSVDYYKFERQSNRLWTSIPLYNFFVSLFRLGR